MIALKTMMPYGMKGHEIRVEIASSKSLPSIDIIGLADGAIKESKDRIRAAFRHCNIDIPPRKFVINLAPSHIKKNGSIFDLAIATCLLATIYQRDIDNKFHQMIWLGELGLDGSIKGSHSVFAAVMAGIEYGYTTFVIPYENCDTVSHIKDITIYGVKHFTDIVNMFTKNVFPEAVSYSVLPLITKSLGTLYDIHGHVYAKRALTIAACGMHHVLMIGPPGSGKSMLAKAVRDVLPPLSDEELIEIHHIYSLRNSADKLIRERPFRTVHATTSKIAVTGGGQLLLPGELSLAHKGVLFFDEIAEFRREVLEALRQPIEDNTITITRASGSVEYPCKCMFVCAMNPCPCGYFGDEEKICTCSRQAIKKYQHKLSGPLLDRIDIILPVNREKLFFSDKNTPNDIGQDQSELYEKINHAYNMQQKRYKDTLYFTNSDVLGKDIGVFMPLDQFCRDILQVASKKLSLSLRVIHKIIRVARSIADFDGDDNIQKKHILEALQYRYQDWLIQE